EREYRRDKGNGRRVHAVGGWPLTRGRQGGHRRRAAPGISARRAAARRSTARGIPARTSWRLWRRRWLGIRIHRQRLAVLERLQDLRRDLDGFLDDWLLSRFLARHNRGRDRDRVRVFFDGVLDDRSLLDRLGRLVVGLFGRPR